MRRLQEDINVYRGEIDKVCAEISSTNVSNDGGRETVVALCIKLSDLSLASMKLQDKLLEKSEKLHHLESHIAQNNSATTGVFPTAVPKASGAEDDSGLKELRKLKPQPFMKGMDLPTFLEKFASWVRVSKIKLENLDEILLAMITDPTTYRKFKSINLTKAEKSNIDLLIEAYNRFLYSETEIAILKSNFQKLKQEGGETVEKFISRIQDMGMKAYRDNRIVREDVSGTRLIEGIRDDRIRVKLLERGTNSFEELTKEALKYERILNSDREQRTTKTDEIYLDILAVGDRDPPTNLDIEIPPNSQHAPSLRSPNHKIGSPLQVPAASLYSGHIAQRELPGTLSGPDAVDPTTEGATPSSAQPPPSQQRSDIKCFNCGLPGHLSRGCASRLNNSRGNPASKNRKKSDMSNMQCWTCQGYGHLYRQCTSHSRGKKSRAFAPKRIINAPTVNTANERPATCASPVNPQTRRKI